MARLDRDPNRGHTNTLEPSRGAPLPAVSRDLIAYLEKAFPNALPPEGTPREEIERLWGERRVIAHLKRMLEQIEQEQQDVFQPA